MKKRIKHLGFLPIILPIVFVVIFFGYMPPRFDAIIYTDNIEGEGTCSTYLSSGDVSFGYMYEGNAYFGSELKTLRLPGLRYNIDDVSLYVYGVDSADILAFDISVFGRIVTHVSSDGISHPFSPDTVREAVASTESPIVHMEIEDPGVGSSVSLSGFDFIPGWVWAAYLGMILLISALLSLGFGFVAERHPGVVMPVLSASTVMAALTLGAFFCGSTPYVDYLDFLLNWVLLFAAALAISALTLVWVGPMLVSGLTLFWYVANFFVISFRSKPIMPSDLRALGTAREVASGYNLTPNWQMLLSIAVVALYWVGCILLWRRARKQGERPSVRRRLISRGAALALAAGMIFFGVNNPAFARLNRFQWDAKVLECFHREGILLTFVQSALSAHVARPEGYSREAVDDSLAKYRAMDAGGAEGTRPVNIIMVMDEAFSDLRTVGLPEDIDVMPFIDSLQEDTLEGRLYVSVYGGGTCNSEFEALTGNSMAFLGTGAYPYTENVTSPLFSLAAYLRDSGYVTEAFHSNEAGNWNRNVVYPFIGFETFHALDDYPPLTPADQLHSHPADFVDFRYMASESAALRGQNRFFFNVTMQNHADYDHFEGMAQPDTVKAHEDDLHENARVYLSLIKASDDAVRELVEGFRDTDEPTMIVFFGDHQPGLKPWVQANVYTHISNNLDFFKTKFFIWTNYETEAVHDVGISANFLPWLVLDRGNFPLPPYLRMLREVHEKYPVISSQGVMDAEGNVYGSVAELMDDPLIREYQYVQYANLFDKLDEAWFRVE